MHLTRRRIRWCVTQVSPSTAVERALAARESLLDDRATERVPPAQIGGRVLAAHVVASADVPPHDRATMDGYAFAAADGYPLRVADDLTESEPIAPEDDPVSPNDGPPTIRSGDAVRITTGAPLPEHADAVLERERAHVENASTDTGDAPTLDGPPIEAGRNVFRRGTTAADGETIFDAGTRLAAPDAGLLADLGVADVPVFERLTVRVLGTGTELVRERQPDRDSPMVAALARSWGQSAEIVDPVADEPDAVREAIARHADAADVIVTSGGTGGGARDHVRSALSDLGEIVVDGVDVRPGSHVRVAVLDTDAVAVALPGKPVAAFLAAASVCRALLAGETAEPTERSRLACDLAVPDRDTEYVIPVERRGDRLVPLGHADSSTPIYGARFSPRVLADCARVLQMDGYLRTRDSLESGESVDFVPREVVT